jgi:hypothetical protein
LIRIGLAALIWARWANQLVLFRNPELAYYVLVPIFFVASTAMLVGFASRWSTALAGITTLTMVYYFGYVLGREPWTHHHTFLLAFSTLLCALTPCGRSYSLDRWFAVRRAERAGKAPPAERGNVWGLRLIALQVCLIYLYTAYDKSSIAFLSGDRMEHYLMWYYLGSNYPSWPGFHELMMAASVFTVALEYTLAFGLLIPTARKWLVPAGVLLHASFYVLLPVATYSLTMIMLYLALLDPDAVRQAIDRMQGYGAPDRVAGRESGS